RKSGNGTAGLFQVAQLKSGTGLRVIGRVRFDHGAGVASVGAGSAQVTVTPGIDLTAASAVVATLLGPAGGATVAYVQVHANADTFTIVLTKQATVPVKVAGTYSAEICGRDSARQRALRRIGNLVLVYWGSSMRRSRRSADRPFAVELIEDVLEVAM